MTNQEIYEISIVKVMELVRKGGLVNLIDIKNHLMSFEDIKNHWMSDEIEIDDQLKATRLRNFAVSYLIGKGIVKLVHKNGQDFIILDW